MTWILTEDRIALTDGEEPVGCTAICTASCAKSVAGAALPDRRDRRTVWDSRYWPRGVIGAK